MPHHPNTRRAVIKGLAAGAAGLAAVAAAPASAGVSTPAGGTGLASPPERDWIILSPLKPGEHLGLGWRAARLVRGAGAWTLTLAHPELGLARLAICYHQGSPKGVASTGLLDLVLMDGGRGDRRTEESVGRVVLALSALIRRNELALAEDFPHLMTHAERIDRYGPERL